MNIPKILHLYWGRNNPLTFLQYLTVVSFREHNPDWKIKVYYPIKTCNNISWKTFEQKTKIISKDYFNELDKHNVEKIEIDFDKIGFKNDYPEVIKSDFFRYHILCKEGGIWSDFDILYIKPFSNIDFSTFKSYGNKIDFIINFHKYDWGDEFYSIGFLGSTPNNKIIKRIVDKCKNNVGNNYQSIGNMYLMKLLGRPKDNMLVLPKEFYLPYCSSKINLIFNNTDRKYINKDTIGIHWFNGHPIAREFQNKLEKGVNSKNGSIWVYIEKYLKYKTL
jgi:hypothetical protein